MFHPQAYWSDSYLERIERVAYDGTGRRLVIRRHWVENIFGLALHNNFLYITSQRNGTLARVHRWNDLVHDRYVLGEWEKLLLPGTPCCR